MSPLMKLEFGSGVAPAKAGAQYGNKSRSASGMHHELDTRLRGYDEEKAYFRTFPGQQYACAGTTESGTFPGQ